MRPLCTSRPLIRLCGSLGIHYVDRGKESCKWSTVYCAKHCYYRKFLRYPQMKGYLQRASFAWEYIEPSHLLNISRLRLCKVGDPFTNEYDINRIKALAQAAPNTLIWAPTRAWRSPILRELLKPSSLPINLKVLASIDPSNTTEEVKSLQQDGWSTMFFGDDIRHPTGKSYKCPKTWQKIHKFCSRCTNGCFKNERVDVWLRKH